MKTNIWSSTSLSSVWTSKVISILRIIREEGEFNQLSFCLTFVTFKFLFYAIVYVNNMFVSLYVCVCVCVRYISSLIYHTFLLF